MWNEIIRKSKAQKGVGEKKVKIMVEGRKKILWMIKPVLFDLFHSLLSPCVCLSARMSVSSERWETEEERGGR